MIKLNNRYHEAYYNRGQIKYSLLDYKGALKEYNKAIKLNPLNRNYYINRGITKSNLSDKKGSCLDWEEGYKLGSKRALKWIEEECE